MNLTGKQKNYLRGIAHKLNPVVTIGAKGLTEAVQEEINLALDAHELIKIKLPSNDKQAKAALISTISSESGAQPVQLIGRIGVIYRPNDEPKIMLPSI
jgi:RNA-binding protein